MCDPYVIANIGVKQFPACFAVNPAVNALLEIRRSNQFTADDIESVCLETYPYSYDLNEGVGRKLNRTSAKLSLYYCAAVALQDGELSADAFQEKAFQNKTYDDLMNRIEIRKHAEYGTGDKAVRGCIATVRLKDGRVLSHEYDAGKHKKAWTDELLRERYWDQVKGALPEKEAEELYDLVRNLSADTPFEKIAEYLNRVRRIG